MSEEEKEMQEEEIVEEFIEPIETESELLEEESAEELLTTEDIIESFISKKYDHKETILSLFKDLNTNNPKNPILIFTTKTNYDDVPLKYSLYHLYLNQLAEDEKALGKKKGSIEPYEYGAISNKLAELEAEGEIISLSQLIPEKYKRYNYNKIIKAFKPAFRKKGEEWIFSKDLAKKTKIDRETGKPVTKEIIDRKTGKKSTIEVPVKVLSPIYLLKLGNDQYALEILIAEINDRLAEFFRDRGITAPTKIPKKVGIPTGIPSMLPTIEEEGIDLFHRFENQRLKTDEFSILDYYFEDMVNFLGESFHRRCQNEACSDITLIPNNDINQDPVNKPVQNMDQYKYYLEQHKFLSAKFEDVIEGEMEEHPFMTESKYDPKSRQNFIQALTDIRRGMRCPKCNGSLVKQRLLKTEKVVFDWLIGVDSKRSSILYGYPDSAQISCV